MSRELKTGIASKYRAAFASIARTSPQFRGLTLGITRDSARSSLVRCLEEKESPSPPPSPLPAVAGVSPRSPSPLPAGIHHLHLRRQPPSIYISVGGLLLPRGRPPPSASPAAAHLLPRRPASSFSLAGGHPSPSPAAICMLSRRGAASRPLTRAALQHHTSEDQGQRRRRAGVGHTESGARRSLARRGNSASSGRSSCRRPNSIAIILYIRTGIGFRLFH